MRTCTRTFSAALAAISVSAAVAGPLDKSRVPADAGWVVHFDVEAALRSSVVQACLDSRDELGMEGFDMAQLKDEFGIDPMTDIKDATVFGRRPDGQDAVAILTTTAAVDDAIERLREKGHGYEKVPEGAYELYAWTEDGHTHYGLVRRLAGDRRLLILSKHKAGLVAAADLAGGRGESLKGRKDSALAADPGAGAVLFVATDVIPTHGHAGPESMVLGKARAVRVEVGESGGDCYAEVNLTMNSTEDATNVVQVLQGLQAMARMVCQSNPDLAPLKALLDAETLEAREDSIVAQVRYPSAKLIEAIKAAGEGMGDDEDGPDDDGEDEDRDGGEKEPL